LWRLPKARAGTIQRTIVCTPLFGWSVSAKPSSGLLSGAQASAAAVRVDRASASISSALSCVGFMWSLESIVTAPISLLDNGKEYCRGALQKNFNNEKSRYIGNVGSAS
jgi:hypothetical protein